jgi:hypothetical protein
MSANLFDSMRAFGRKTKTVRLASPDDVISERKTWSDADLSLPEHQRGEPIRVELELKPDAEFMTFQIRPLSMAQREAADALLDSVVPPRAYIHQPSDRPGQEPVRVPAGYDEEDPAYLAALRPLYDLQAAFVALHGVEGLRESTAGETDRERATAIMEAMPTRMVKFLAASIWAMTYAQGDPLDFFTSAAYGPSPSSAPSPSPNPPAKKRK